MGGWYEGVFGSPTPTLLPPQVLWSMSCSPGVQSHSKPITMSLQMCEQPPLLRRHSLTSGEQEEKSVFLKWNVGALRCSNSVDCSSITWLPDKESHELHIS